MTKKQVERLMNKKSARWVAARNIQDFYRWQTKHPEYAGTYIQFPKDLQGLDRSVPVQETHWFRDCFEHSMVATYAKKIGYHVEYEKDMP